MKPKFSILVLLLLTGSVYGQPPKPVGKILHVQGRAYRQDRQTRTTLPSGDQNTPLFATQEIGCISKCKITFKIGSRPFVKSTRYVIPNQVKPLSNEKNFVVAGGKKSGADIILLPIESNIGIIRPESFTFRWRVVRINNRVVEIRPLTVSLSDCQSGERIWHKAQVDYTRGSYSPKDVIRELRKLQAKDSNSKIEIALGSESFDKNQRFCFSMISISAEEKLQTDLAVWDEYAVIIRLTERARVFEKHRLFQDALLEYEEALKMFPKTDYLLAEAIKAYLRIGDTDQAIELVERLRRISPRNREYLRMKRTLREISHITTSR